MQNNWFAEYAALAVAVGCVVVTAVAGMAVSRMFKLQSLLYKQLLKDLDKHERVIKSYGASVTLYTQMFEVLRDEFLKLGDCQLNMLRALDTILKRDSGALYGQSDTAELGWNSIKRNVASMSFGPKGSASAESSSLFSKEPSKSSTEK